MEFSERFRKFILEDEEKTSNEPKDSKDDKSKDDIPEENKQAVEDATKWMTNKYQDKYEFKYVPNMIVAGEKYKSYDISVGDNMYKLNLRKFDSNGDGEGDTLAFDVMPIAVEPDEPEDNGDDF